MADCIGFVVVEFNQASGQPDLPVGASIHWDREWAEEVARMDREEAARIGRRERYVVCEVVPVEDDDG